MGSMELWDFENLADGRAPRVVLGVDGGSTSTLCVCVNANSSKESPKVIGRAVAGCSNRNSVGDELANAALELALAGALKNAGVPRSSVQAVCVGISGVDTRDDEERMLSWLSAPFHWQLFPRTSHIFAYNDAVAALASGTLGKLHGCVLVVGTGTIAYGFTSDGRKTRCSGYGPLLGDQGSGFAIASQALASVTRAHDGRGPPTALSGAILKHLHLKHVDDLISWAYTDSSWARVAALVPVVKACAAAGDFAAQEALNFAVQELSLSVNSVVTRLGLAGEDGKKPFPLVLVGGVLEKNDSFDLVSAIVHCVCASFPGVEAIRPQVEPAVGAALLALRQSSVATCNGDMSAAEV
ncbi:N-acetyl-D-glucosamine kinase isoform X1 [Selaginella moellendorffii]|uniref:N-acetyl-D-glucosamine kinase isoform X1 n=1 Tax=Selaginella moellendorffii TaxID=88036 RepID=UPI000D1C5491|nr:N-acetyl-D-glucosamine kinase isoform X1 [Selaginella moellendorffii]|eukprot:XP_024517373.1 N-acetyl-D-glucosamine kinase isoform X1 [Selaginella moellendorffii]